MLSKVESNRSESRLKESTAELDDKVLELLNQNIPAIRIAEILKKQKSTIYRVQDRLLRTGRIAALPAKVKRKTPRRALELRAKVKELLLLKHAPARICEILHKTRQAIYPHVTNLVKDGELRLDQINYIKAPPIEERKWYKIIERTGEELPFYERQGLVPTARKMGYRLIELAVAAKNAGNTDLISLGLPDLGYSEDPKYKKKKKSFFDGFYKKSAEARKGVDSTYRRPTSLPRLPIDCFKDDLRDTIGDDDDRDVLPEDPTPDEAPKDPEEWIDGKIENTKSNVRYANDRVEELKDAPSEYDGSCDPGTKGVDPGNWYSQPTYCHIFCESETIQPDLVKWQNEKKVKVSAMRGFPSTPFIYRICKDLKRVVDTHPTIEKIVILYFGDSDSAGKKIAKNIKFGLKFYSGGGTIIHGTKKIDVPASTDLQIPVEVEFKQIAITPEQVKKYKLTGFQLEAFMTTEERLKDFKKIVQDAIDDCWDEDVWEENRPPEEYEYGVNEEVPEDIDPDNEYYDDETEETYTEMMQRKVDKALETIWDD